MSIELTGPVAYVLKRYPRFSETFVVNEILAHEAAGLDVRIFSLRPPEDTHFQEIIGRVRAPVHYLRSDGKQRIWEELSTSREDFPGLEQGMQDGLHERGQEVYQAVLLAREIQRHGIRHMHAHFATSATAVARLASIFTGVPYSLTAHAKDIFHDDVNDDDMRRKLSDAAYTVTVSDFNRSYLRERFGADAERVVRIYNGIELPEFPYAEPRERPDTILAVGRLVEKKGFHVLLDACAMLSARGRRFQCAIIGDGEERRTLEQQIKILGLLGKVELCGPQSRDEVRRRLHEAAVLAAPCVVGKDGNRDGLPTILLEAMAMGAPCVSTDLVGIGEAIQNDATGLLIPPNDPVALANSLERLLDDADARVKLAANARALIEKEFNIETNTRALRELFAAAIPVA